MMFVDTECGLRGDNSSGVSPSLQRVSLTHTLSGVMQPPVSNTFYFLLEKVIPDVDFIEGCSRILSGKLV
jgi:hypothetical protein